jgi:hypothetical protein
MQEHSRKEISTAMLKRRKDVRDYRVSEAPREWDEYLEE